jgi:hypothetical protein
MKTHPSFAAAVVIFCFASSSIAHTQEIKADTGGVAVGGNVTNSTINIGIPRERRDPSLVIDVPLSEGTYEMYDSVKIQGTIRAAFDNALSATNVKVAASVIDETGNVAENAVITSPDQQNATQAVRALPLIPGGDSQSFTFTFIGLKAGKYTVKLAASANVDERILNASTTVGLGIEPPPYKKFFTKDLEKAGIFNVHGDEAALPSEVDGSDHAVLLFVDEMSRVMPLRASLWLSGSNSRSCTGIAVRRTATKDKRKHVWARAATRKDFLEDILNAVTHGLKMPVPDSEDEDTSYDPVELWTSHPVRDDERFEEDGCFDKFPAVFSVGESYYWFRTSDDRTKIMVRKARLVCKEISVLFQGRERPSLGERVSRYKSKDGKIEFSEGSTTTADGVIEPEVLSFKGIDYNYVTYSGEITKNDFPVVVSENTSGKRSVIRFVPNRCFDASLCVLGRLFRLERCEING